VGGFLLGLGHHDLALHEHEVAVHLSGHPGERCLLVQHSQVAQYRYVKVCWE